MAIENIEQKMLAYALKNAVEHEGKCQSGAVLNPLFHEGLERDKVKEVMPQINEIVKKVNSMSLEEQKTELEEAEKLISHRKERVGMPELPNVPTTGVIMRYAPAASGYLHLGHASSNCANAMYVKRYGGKFYIRIEDTNPEEVVPDAYEKIKEDCDWLFGNVYEYIIQSDRVEVYYQYAQKLIDSGNAFICTCKKEEARVDSEEVHVRKPCNCRNNSIKENQEKWNKMLDANGLQEGEAVLRFKSDINNPNPAMIDFPLARINTHKHPRVGNKYRVWPLMNLSVTVDDIEYKMTHVIRGKDHKDNSKRQEMIYEALGKKDLFPWTFFMGRYKFEDIELSKRKILALINDGKFTGREDIRLPTIAALRKRGFQPGAFEKMTEIRGLTEADKVFSKKDYFKLLGDCNREIIKPMSIEIEFTEKKSKENPNEYILLRDDASESKIYTKEKLENEKIYFLKDIGFVKLNDKTLWYCHD